MKMKEQLTAGKAREIFEKWQENKCADYVERALATISERANRGYFTADVLDPYPENVNRDTCIKAMQDLGFVIDHTWKDYTRWRW